MKEAWCADALVSSAAKCVIGRNSATALDAPSTRQHAVHFHNSLRTLRQTPRLGQGAQSKSPEDALLVFICKVVQMPSYYDQDVPVLLSHSRKEIPPNVPCDTLPPVGSILPLL